MARRQWQVVVAGRERRVEVEHGYLSGRRRIWIDGAEVAIPEDEQHPFPDAGSVQPFAVDGVPCAIVIRTDGLTFSYDLVVDGISRATGRFAAVELIPPEIPNHVGAPAAMMREPIFGIVFFAVTAVLSAALTVYTAHSLASRPDVPPRVALGHSSEVPDGTWVMLEELELDCSAPPNDLGRHSYRAAGRDEQGVPVFVLLQPDPCPNREATGALGDARGTDGAALRRLANAPRVRSVLTFVGPANDRLGVILGSVLGLLSVAAVVLFERERRRRRRRAARLAAERDASRAFPVKV